jgi:hypothetical protein
MLRVTYPGGAEKERLYTIDVIFGEFLGLDILTNVGHGDRTTIELLGSSSGRSVTVADEFFTKAGEYWLEERSLPSDPVKAMPVGCALAQGPLSQSYPAFFGEAQLAEFAVTASKNAIDINLDVFGLTFFMLSRYEEAVISDRDEHGRFPSQQAMVIKANYHHRAIVNEYIEILWAAISTQWPSLKRKRRDYNLDLSHDVDEPFCTLRQSPASVARSAMADIIKRRSIGLGIARCRSYLGSMVGNFEHDPANTFGYLMGLSEKAGVQSTFNFLSGRTNVKYDAKYELTNVQVRALLVAISARGHHIGFHGSYDSGANPNVIALEFARLRDACDNLGFGQTSFGGRQHYLRWWNPVTWQAWDASGLSYDSSVGFSDRVGFRCGVCYEYPVYDVRERRVLGLRERPLIAMDIAVLREVAWDRNAALNLLTEMCRECRKYNGNFTLLWHNTRLLTPADKEFYISLFEGIGSP